MTKVISKDAIQIAKEALALVEKRVKKAPGGPVSRDADKFVARLPTGMRERLDARSQKDGQSMNAVLVDALDEYLDVREDQQIELAALQLLKKELQDALANLVGTYSDQPE